MNQSFMILAVRCVPEKRRASSAFGDTHISRRFGFPVLIWGAKYSKTTMIHSGIVLMGFAGGMVILGSQAEHHAKGSHLQLRTYCSNGRYA
jgi:hypothetical protein